MIATGSWDYGSIVKQSRFPIGIFPIPLPERDDPRYGAHVLGPISEAGQGLGVMFHLTKQSAHPEVAIDFLQFLTSQPGNQLFCDISKWLPAIVGVRPPAETAAFAPLTEGYPDGFRIALLMWGRGEMYRVFGNHVHRLVGRGGGVNDFVSALRSDLTAAVRADARRLAQTYLANIQRQDTTVAALRHLGQADKATAVLETQNQQEALYYWLQSQLR
jgi:hypothetical protein